MMWVCFIHQSKFSVHERAIYAALSGNLSQVTSSCILVSTEEITIKTQHAFGSTTIRPSVSFQPVSVSFEFT